MWFGTTAVMGTNEPALSPTAAPVLPVQMPTWREGQIVSEHGYEMIITLQRP